VLRKICQQLFRTVTSVKRCLSIHKDTYLYCQVYSHKPVNHYEPHPVAVQRLNKEAVAFLNDFDIDGDGTFSFDEFLLFLVLLSMPLKDMQACLIHLHSFLSSFESCLHLVIHFETPLSRANSDLGCSHLTSLFTLLVARSSSFEPHSGKVVSHSDTRAIAGAVCYNG
jgi:hypothetical protein